MRRRTFLSLGITGAAALAAAGWWASLSKRSPNQRALDENAAGIIAAIAQAMLDGALPATGPDRQSAIAQTVEGVDRAVLALPPAAQAELGQLFSLLALAPARLAFAGVASPWQEASVAEVGAFLDRWRDSSWGLKRSAYDALHQLVIAAWYANPRAWPAIGYPGPPALR
jgi:hypothetical protein